MATDLLDMSAKRSRKRPAWSPEQIKALRLSLGLTQTEAAHLVEADLRTWQRWEAGDKPPSRCHLRLIQMLADGKL